jgi:hypothetical protein
MATKATYNTSIPHDEPIEIRPGVMHREFDFHGSSRWYALAPEHPENTAKGDIGWIGLATPRVSFESGEAPPFSNLRKQ